MSNVTPRIPGFYIFDGARHIRDAMYEHIREPVQVIEMQNGQHTELAVQMTGRAAKFPIGNFSGTWQALVLEEA